MLAIFCLRLACGMAGALLIVPPREANPRFFRVQFLAVLGLTAAAAFVARLAIDSLMWIALGGTMLGAFLGSVVWSLEGAPLGRILLIITTFGAVLGLLLAPLEVRDLSPERSPERPWLAADDLTAAALLGAATTAMLMGHSYLIAPAMSMTPLMRLLALLFGATMLRMLLAGAGLWFWTREHSLANLQDETVLWLPVRWGVGFVGPLVLGGMAFQTAKIRSTQSATGILYVVVILCFLGELTSQLLLRSTGSIL